MVGAQPELSNLRPLLLENYIMRISVYQINQLKPILLEITGKEYSSEELQNEGLKILRFVYALERRKHLNISIKRDPQVHPKEVMPQSGLTSQEIKLIKKELNNED